MLVLAFVVILATGNGVTITSQDVYPYWIKFTKIYGHAPESLEEKREVLMNCIADMLLIRRAEELGVETDKEFLKQWKEAKHYADERCEKDGIDENTCSIIKKRLKHLLEIEYVLSKDFLPKIKLDEDEVKRLVELHYGFKKVTPEIIRGFLKEKVKAEAFNRYIESLMKRYRIKINSGNLKSLTF